MSATRQLDLGLRWLDAEPDAGEGHPATVSHWPEFLEQADSLPVRHRLRWLKAWPLLAAVNGLVAFSGLMVWPDRSGVHLLVFLAVFWLGPVALMLWAGVSGVVLGRTPWWGRWLTGHGDRVIALWCARQSWLAQGAFCLAGLAWLWAMLVTRQVIFYWSTSIGTVSALVDDFFRLLTLGWLAPPEPVVVGASQAGAITGWESELLQYSYYWALWLTQVVALWVLAPLTVLLVAAQVLLRRRLAHWPETNMKLRQRYDIQRKPALAFRSLQPEHPATESLRHEFPVVLGMPGEPGFVWQCGDRPELPDGCVVLGEADHGADMRAIQANAQRFRRWYIGGQAVPTGDLADLVQQHREHGGSPRLSIVLPRGMGESVDALKLGWSAFIDRNDLAVEAELVAPGEVADADR